MNRPKGTKDIFGVESSYRRYVISVMEQIAHIYGYDQIETPIFERKEVYVKGVGETSDIVGKEMYDFKDKKGREMTLRPEGTAGTIRAIVENKLYTTLPYKAYYIGPMFRYENPQKGRQRQFTQFGVEVISDKSPILDVEVILMANMIVTSLEIDAKIYINSIGDIESRKAYAVALKDYFNANKAKLTKDSVNRIETNPMRILDDKVDSKKDVVKNAPKISQFYTQESKDYFTKLQSLLTQLGIIFEIDETIVRGLDYYSETTFEIKSTSGEAGSQDTLIGGGRYEQLVEQMGGPKVGGVGFAVGLERIINEVKTKVEEKEIRSLPYLYVMNIDEESTESCASIVYMLRLAGYATVWNMKAVKLQKAFDKADKSGAHVKIIAGPKELAKGKVMVKHLDKQEAVDITRLVSYIEGISHEH